MSGGCYRECVKVVVINTQYIETDARSFKSVVQSLTGKDSPAESTVAPPGLNGSGEGTAEISSTLSRGLSFKDFDHLFMNLPPLEELYRALY
nr:VQ motif-containing protein 1-like [Ipomoea batatas]